MLPADKDTRDLLPLMAAAPTTIAAAESEVCRGPVPEDGAAFDAPGLHRISDAAGDSEEEHSGTPTPFAAIPSSHPVFDAPEAIQGEATGLHLMPAPAIQAISVSQPSGKESTEGTGDHDPRTVGHSSPITARGDGTAEWPTAGSAAGETDDAHSINLTQIAEVDQDASIVVRGYAGEVVARLHIDQDIMMDQDVDFGFIIDGDGHFVIRLDQDMRIEQEIDIDLEIFGADGVLYVDLYVSDSIEIEQDTKLDMWITDGPPGGTVQVHQDIELEQDVDIDIQIEDDLEERYAIKVDIDVIQEVDADQDAAIDVAYANGEIDMDVDAVQMAAVDQETVAQIDFALV
ncbi:hypothetical protein [Microvirga brassicacearum]|uniref:Uncharacterized protein n=1 Tax=Microvirga brassicacearum TaxID=2580413 RepID=A0A5N3PGM4_9HYPH|nr:hypothetical protein [Microvirga brassicacearum]KAB0268868.1 hypothetical protein FEZ63_01760 [Microvirga brassicacearum]